ncbi:MAG: DUF433 domain-containing protein [Hyphomicrobiaceae bacterium]
MVNWPYARDVLPTAGSPYDHLRRLAGGEPCITGRREAMKVLFDYIKSSHTLEDFLADFPSVAHKHAMAVINLASRAVALPDGAE